MDITRRGVLAVGAALTMSGRALAQTAPAGLNALAKARGMRFGSAFSWSPPGADRGSFANPAYAALLERDCGILVPENEMKWQALRPDARTFSFDHFSDMLDYADAHGMPMRGHTLLWHKTQRFPAWLNSYDFGVTPVKEAERILGLHINTVTRYFGARIPSFDVVNETVDERDGSLRTSSLAKAFGGTEAMLDYAFHTARAGAPASQLVYNDYMSWEAGNEAFRTGVLKLLEGFRKRGVPIDALGVQSHIGVHETGTGKLIARQEKPWRAFLDEAVAMGYKLVVTEFDVNDNGLPADPAIRDKAVADYARAYLDICFDYPQLKDVLAWGMCDKYCWLNGFMPRPDGQIHRSTPYDAGFQAKPLYAALEGAFRAAAVRS